MNFLRKSTISFVVFLCLFLQTFSCMAAGTEIALSTLTSKELNHLSELTGSAVKAYHQTNSEQESKVLSATKAVVEQHFSGRGIKVSWPWFDYTYSRDWDTYKLVTRIDYKDENKKSQTDSIVSVVYRDGNEQYTVIYLSIDEKIIIDNHFDYPSLWAEEPQTIEYGNVNLSILTLDDLYTLQEKIEAELKANHSTDSNINDFVLLLTKNRVEQYFLAQGIVASWPWSGYNYACDWGRYTLDTTVNYKIKGKNTELPVHAEAEPQDGIYRITALQLGDIDLERSTGTVNIQGISSENEVISTEDSAAPQITPQPAESGEPQNAQEDLDMLATINGVWISTDSTSLDKTQPYCLIENGHVEYCDGFAHFNGIIDPKEAELPNGGFSADGTWLERGANGKIVGLMETAHCIVFYDEADNQVTLSLSDIPLNDDMWGTDYRQGNYGVYLTFTTATDEQLAQAIIDIKNEQRNRLTTRIEFSETEIRLAKGKTKKLRASVVDIPDGMTASKITWKSEDKAVVTYSNGQITAVKAGSTNIYCESTLSDGTVISAQCPITVYIPVSSITPSKTKYNLDKGDQIWADITVKPSTATNSAVTYQSSAPQVAAVDDKGYVSGLSVGTAIITVTAEDGSGKNATFTVEVKEKQAEQVAASVDQETYIGNRNTKKFHHAWCSSVSRMKESNMVELVGRDKAISKGYSPCQKCCP